MSKMDKVVTKSRSESAMLAANKSCHVISKPYSAAKDEGRSSKYWQHKNMMTPRIRIVYVYEPEIIKTDRENFRSVVQKLTGKPLHNSNEKKRKRNSKSPLSEVACAQVGTENIENTFYNNDKMTIMENKSTDFLIEDFSGLSKLLDDMDMIFPDVMNERHENPLVWNNSPFCNMYDQTGLYHY